jgi:glucokinase-like ROK family protein
MKFWISKNQQSLSGKELKKYLQNKRVIKYLYQRGHLTNSYLAKKLDLSIPTVQAILNELIADGLVQEQGLGTSNGGRRPSLYSLAENSLFVVGVDMNRYKTRMAIFNHFNENITGTITYDLKLESDMSVLQKVHEKVEELIAHTPINRDKIIGIGINMPGLVDSTEGINHTYFNFATPVRDILEEMFGLPVFIENDAKARALAEHKYGEATAKKNVLAIYLDWGVGLGMIFNGKLYKGKSGFAGEFSHIPLIENGELCVCGKKGCLETIASATALARMAKEGLKKGNDSILNNLVNEDMDKLEAQIIIEAARNGDQFAITLLSRIGHDLGKGIATLIQLLNPEMIILGGRMSQGREYLMTSIHQSLYKYCIPKLREDTEIVYSKLGNDAGVLGALAVVVENIFE